MGLKTIVKLSQVTNLSDARYAAGMGVQMLGFNINPESEHYVSPEKFNEITGWVSGVDLIGEFDGNVFSFSPGYEFNLIQISNSSFVDLIKDMGKKIIFELDLDNITEEEAEQAMMQLKPEVDYFLLKSADGKVNPPKLKTWSRSFPILLGYGFEEENLNSILSEYNIKGISLIGGEEKVVGFKDYDHLSAILEELTVDGD